MFKKILLASLLTVASVTSANDGDTDRPANHIQEHSGHQASLPFPVMDPTIMMDPSKWWDGAGHVEAGATVPFNPMDPRSWAMFADPSTHTKMHMAFTNPAQYAQFMNPQFFMQMMNPAVWQAWMNPASYATFIDPKTWAYWMQPGAYMHGMNPQGYMQFMNPAAYQVYFNPATYTGMMNFDTALASSYGHQSPNISENTAQE